MEPLVSPAVSVLCGLVLFLLPGLVLLALAPRADRDALGLAEASFLVVACSVGASAWVALVLAEAGRFSLVSAAVLLAAGSAVALAWGWRRAHGPLPRAGAGAAATAAVLALAVALQARPGEYIMGGRDPGTYIAGMALIARTGGVVYTDPGVLSIPPEDVALFYRNPGGPDYTWGRFMGFPLERPQTGRVVPEFFHLFPAFGAYLFQSMGVRGALATPCLFGVLGTLAFFFAWRRLFGPAAGALAALLLGLDVVQVWFARYPVAEPMTQFLVWTGVLAFALWEERRAPLFGALAGTLFGLALLCRIDSALVLVPIGLYVLARRARGELSWRALRHVLVPMVVLGAHALVHAAFWTRKYLLAIATRRYWDQPWWVWAGLGALAVAAVLVAHRFEPTVVRWMDVQGARVRRAAMAAVVLLALYCYFLRPALSAWAGGDGNDPARMRSNFAALDHDHDGFVDRREFGPHPDAWGHDFATLDRDGDGRLSREEWRGNPPTLLRVLGFHRLAAHDAQSLVRLGWFVTPLGLLLAVLGVVVVLGDWHREWLFPLLLIGVFSAFYLYKIRIWNDYYFALRRFMPVTLPALLGLAALVVVRLWARGALRRALAAALVLFLAVAFLRDTLPLVAYRDWRNSVRFVDDVARRFGPGDVVIFEQPRAVHLLSLPLWAVHGVNALELARFDPDPARLGHLVEAWRSRYRNIYFVHTYSTNLCGLFLEKVEDLGFGTYEWERAYDRKPAGPRFQALRFRISRVLPPQDLQVPALPEVDIGGSDDFQVSGFYDKEGFGERTYRWTGRCASVYLPGAHGGDTAVITVSSGQRPARLPAHVEVSMGGVRLGGFEAGAAWTEEVVALPAVLPPGPPVLRFDVRAWRPANELARSTDLRDLGVMVDRIRLRAGPG